MNTIKFLIVDDELLLAHSTASMLQSLGFERYAIEPTLAGAIKRIEQGVDVALLDINLGRGDEGIELEKFARNIVYLLFTSVVILTRKL